MGYDIPGPPDAECGMPADDIILRWVIFQPGPIISIPAKWETSGAPDFLAGHGRGYQRGQKEFTIDCAVCHGATGQGNGITSKYGLLGIANYHQDKYRQMADGQIFNTITHGYNTMMSYGDKVTVKDRWAIIAYIRAHSKEPVCAHRRCSCGSKSGA